MAEAQAWIRDLLVGVVLAVYLVVFIQELVQCWRGPTPPANEARTYIWTSFGALIGGVTAFYLGVDLPKALAFASATAWKPTVDDLRAVYAVAYILSGLSAAVTWTLKPDAATPLLKNTATTFIGLSVAVVSALLIPQRH